MRATISFDTDVDQVEGTMAVIACSEEHNLRAAADILSNYTVLDGSLLDALTEVLRLLDMSADQLKQYRNMLVNFERAKYETILPQEVPASVAVNNKASTQTSDAPSPEAIRNIQGMQATLQAMRDFGSFVDKINSQNKEEEETDGLQPQEG
jgi:hypothetical protein